MSLKFTTVRPILWFLRLIGALLALLLILMLAFPIGFYGMAMYIEPSLPKTRELKAMPLEMPLQIYSKDGKLIGHYGKTYSLPITYSQLPKKMEQAFLAAEDDSFFEHSGISVKGLGRAITELATDQNQQTGGSTITQQVAKNYFLSSEQTFERKLTEMYLARRIENELSKDEIMTLYVNKIYLGQGAYGIRAGAIRYYNKELDELSIAQMAMLAGLPKAPSEFNPVINPKRALQRRDWILGRMLAQNFINQDEYETAIASPIDLNMYQETLDVDMPYLSEMARTTLVEKYGNHVMNSGWRVVLTVDSQTQQLAEEALINGLYAYDKRHGWRGGVEHQTGDIHTYLPFNGIYPVQIQKLFRGGGFEGITNTDTPIRVARSDARGLKIGNIVRVTQEGDTYKLVQIPKVQGALVSINPDNGSLIALVGGLNFYHNKFNRATQGYRQPGSTIKPLIYTAALESKKYTPDSILDDSPLRIGKWSPKNADGSFRGGMSMRQALAVSRNIPVIRAYLGTGQEKVHAMLANFGLEKNRLPEGAALALGAADATPLQMATAYTAFMNGGHRIQPYFIEQIYNFDNHLVYQANPVQACALCFNGTLDKTNDLLAKNFEQNKQAIIQSELIDASTQLTLDETANTQAVDGKDVALLDNPQILDKQQNLAKKYRLSPQNPPKYTVAEQAPRIMSPATAYNMADMLKGVITSGTAKKAQAIGRPDIGGKTGTTNLAKDAWFAGVHPTAATVVWIGFDDPKSLGAKEYGGVAALPVWVQFMSAYLQDKPVQWVSADNKSKTKTTKQEVIELTDNNPTGKSSNQPKNPAKSSHQQTADDSSKTDTTYTLQFETPDGDIPEGDGEGQ